MLREMLNADGGCESAYESDVHGIIFHWREFHFKIER